MVASESVLLDASPLARAPGCASSPRGSSRSLDSTTVSSRSRANQQASPDGVPPIVASLAALPAHDRVIIETQILDIEHKRNQSRPSSGRYHEALTGIQVARRKLNESARAQKVQLELQRNEIRQAEAQLRKASSARATKLTPSPWAKAPEARSQFQLWNREGSLPQFIVSPKHASRAPAVGTYGKSTSIETGTIAGGTPRCGSCQSPPSCCSPLENCFRRSSPLPNASPLVR